MTALEAHLIGEPEVDDAEPVEAPENLEQADWHLRKLARLRRLMAENEAIANVEIARIRSWLADENAKLERVASFYEHSLAVFHQALLERDPNRRTISLPAGALKARKHPDKVDVIDPAEFVSWATANRPELIRTKVEADKTEIRRLLSPGASAGDYGLVLIDATAGEQVPGVVLVPGETSFTADPDIRGVES